MLITIKNTALIEKANKLDLAIIKQYLTISNPLFNRRLNMGLANWHEKQKLAYYTEHPKGVIEVPVGAVVNLLEKIPTDDVEVIDNRFSNPMPDYFSKLTFAGILRIYQEAIVNDCMDRSIGVVEAMTGAGKTICFIALILRRMEPTLILVHTIELGTQTLNAIIESVEGLTHDDIGFIGDGKFDIKPITIGLHQSLTHLSDERWEILNNTFGQVISDEVHIIAAETFYNNMSKLKAKYKFGFSATPKREDGLTSVIHFAVGPTIHVVPKEALDDVLICPSLKCIETDYYFPLFDMQEYQTMLTDMGMNKARNELIVETLQREFKDDFVCLLCNRVDQVNLLVRMLGEQAVGLTAQEKKKDRKVAMSDLLSKNKQYVVSTFSLFSMGINIPHLNVLFICSPIKSEIKLRQAAGRLMRMADGKTSAIIVDFVDSRIEYLQHSAQKRKKIFERL